MLFNYEQHKNLLKENYIKEGEKFCDILKNKAIYCNTPKIELENGVQYRHYQFTINGVYFPYFEGIRVKHNNTEEKILNALWCLLRDSVSYMNIHNFNDFCAEFGYTDEIEAKEVYKAMGRNYNKLITLLNDDQTIETLLDCFDEEHW